MIRTLASLALLALLLPAPAQAQLPPLADPKPEKWPAYQVIMWAPQTPEGYRALRQYGITAAKVQGIRGTITPEAVAASIAPPLAAEMPWYVENLATDLYSAYHRWTPERPRDPTWLFKEVQRRHRENPADPAIYLREPSLSDPAWHDRIRTRLAETVRRHAAYKPLFYNLGDETGIADLAAYWDFDFSDHSLTAFRAWLRTQYPSLAALNAQWASNFPDWEQVTPPKTTEAMARTDDNHSAWADFRTFMDAEFARALRIGTDAVHAADPEAIVGIEGAQAPGWGGYDYTRLAQSVDLIEMYEGGHNMEIARALNPAIITMSTSFGISPAEIHRIWREALMGNRGTIIWDDEGDYAQGSFRAQILGETFADLTGPLGRLLIATPIHRDPIAILYSPASFRTLWMLDHRAAGPAWAERGSEIEGGADSAHRAAFRRPMRALSRIALQPHILSPEQLAGGALAERGIRLLILPHSIALSDAEQSAITSFLANGGTVVADTLPGTYDSRSRRRPTPALANAPLIPYPASWQRDADPIALADARALAARAGVTPLVTINANNPDARTDIEIRLFRNGNTLIVSVQKDTPTAPPVFDRRTFFYGPVPDSVNLTPNPTAALLGSINPIAPVGEISLDIYKPTIVEVQLAP